MGVHIQGPPETFLVSVHVTEVSYFFFNIFLFYYHCYCYFYFLLFFYLCVSIVLELFVLGGLSVTLNSFLFRSRETGCHGWGGRAVSQFFEGLLWVHSSRFR